MSSPSISSGSNSSTSSSKQVILVEIDSSVKINSKPDHFSAGLNLKNENSIPVSISFKSDVSSIIESSAIVLQPEETYNFVLR
mmetsp:Transcript_8813/g.7786  ORF Transcript_8813/g.7786 Transcript_8813/m.7786 type:complete len:83 (+) Transcript_8813:41-289(+)